MLLVFLVLLVLLVRAKSFCKKKKKNAEFKTALIIPFILLLAFYTSKTKAVWNSLLDAISIRCTFQNNFIPPWNILGDHTGFKNTYTNRYLIWTYSLAFTRFLRSIFWNIAENFKQWGGVYFQQSASLWDICWIFCLFCLEIITWNTCHMLDFSLFLEQALLLTMFDVYIAVKLL